MVEEWNEMLLEGQRVIYSTSGEAVKILDYASQRYRPSTLVDLYDAARLADRMEHIHYFGQPFIASEWSHDLYVHDMNIAYAELAGTQKAFALGIATAEHIDELIGMFDLYLGREGAFLERPFCVFGGCPIVSPLRFAKENAEVLVKVARMGMVGDVAIAAQAGATAPAPLAGALVALAGVVRLRQLQLVDTSVHRPRLHQARHHRWGVEPGTQLVDVAVAAFWRVGPDPSPPARGALDLPASHHSHHGTETRVPCAVLAAVDRSPSDRRARALGPGGCRDGFGRWFASS